jgi:very-short-patch-repair endonuclease
MLTCARCGKEFRLSSPGRVKEGKGRFCSFSCYRKFTGPTSIERRVRETIEGFGVEVHSEFPVSRRMVFDFYIPAFNLLIECDGDYWHSKPGVKKRDTRKDAHARKMGYRVERLSESFITSVLLYAHINNLLRQRSLL